MTSCSCSLHRPRSLSRRGLIAAGAGTVGAALAAGLLPGTAHAAHTEMLLLTCMDFRLENEVLAHMDGRNLRDKYDRVALAGASLAAVTKAYPEWGLAFWSHLDVALKLHEIKKVMVIDHRDCGAYRTILGAEAVATPEMELDVHRTTLQEVRRRIRTKFPQLDVELGLMGLDGAVLSIA